MSSGQIDLMVGNRPLSSLRVVDLKQELEKRGLSKSGSKKDLVDRLRLHLQIEKHRDTGASADEEELPNYSQVHDELADQNPFIRDYLASQAELFHSQKVVKKLVEEEAKRESETSADEGVDSPMKQPPGLEREQSPVTETRRQTRRRGDSQREDMTAEKLTTRSSRSRSPIREKTPVQEKADTRSKEPEQKEQPEVMLDTKSVAADEKADLADNDTSKNKNLEQETSNSSNDIAVEEAKRVSEAVATKIVENSMKHPPVLEREDSPVTEITRQTRRRGDSQQEDATAEKLTESPSGSRSPVREKSPVQEHDETPPTEPDQKQEPETVSEIISAAESNDKMDVDESSSSPSCESSQKEAPSASNNVANEEEENRESESTSDDEVDSSKKQLSPLEREGSPVIETIRQPRKSDDSQSEEKLSTRSSRSRSPVREKSPVQEKVDANSMEPEQKDETETVSDIKSADADEKIDAQESPKSCQKEASTANNEEVAKQESETSADEGTDSSVKEPSALDREKSPVTETRRQTRRRSDSRGEDVPVEKNTTRSSRSRSPIREKSPVQDKSERRSIEPKEKEEPEAASDIKSAEKDEKMDVDESSSPRYKSSQKETSFTNNDIAGEEALDYGEEEDDEDREESDPQEISWTRRSLRFKSKAVFAAPTCKWKLEEESKHLVVKSELLNSYYEDIKLVPLEQLKLEEKSSESTTETKTEPERKISISKESEPEEPLPKRTVENVAPTIKRTVSIIPSTKTSTEDAEETDKALTPPRNPLSDVLLITNLVRPFTIIQLKEMLQRTGNLQDIWVDKIKSKCIAKFASEEEAFETRAALHGVCWPNSNPKSLHVDYSTQDNLDEHKAKEGAEQTPSTEKPVSAQPVPVREWDVGKKAEPKSPSRNRKRSRSRSTSRDRSKRSRRTPSPGRRRRSKSPGQERRSRGGEGKEPEPMGKALDELFRKTIATPSIYWLPLTPEQIAEKEELRRKRMLERERRLAEMNKMRR